MSCRAQTSTPTSVRSRSLRGARALLAALLLAFATSSPVSSAPRQDHRPGSTNAPVDDVDQPQIRLLAQPTSVGPDDVFRAFVSIQGAPDATSLVVDLYDRAEATDVIGDAPPDGPVARFPEIDLSSPTPSEPTDASGSTAQTAGFSIPLYRRGQRNPDPAWGYRIDEPGVYPMRIRVREHGTTLATLYTALIRDPAPDEDAPKPTQGALLVEARRSPPRASSDRIPGDVADRSILDQLDPVIAALDLRPSVPATYVVTPDAIARLAADPTTVEDLAPLRQSLLVDGHDLLDAPYVDIDPATLVAAGLTGELTNQRDLGRGTLSALLGPPQSGTWRLDHRVNTATLDELRQRGIFRAVVPSGAVGGGVLDPASADAGETTVRLAAASPTFTLGAAAPDDPILSAHRLLARLAAVATDRTTSARVVIDVVASIADPVSIELLLDALDANSAWFTPITLSSLLATATSNEATLHRPDPAELGSYPAELTLARSKLASYASMVGKDGDLVRDSERILTSSTAAGLALDQRRDDVDQVLRNLAVPFGAVRIPVEETVTLGARDATFPLTIKSELAMPAQVVVELRSNDRLDFPDEAIPVTLDGDRTTVSIRVRTRSSGDTPVHITVHSPDGGVVLAESRYVVRSTAISGVGLLLTVGAAAFLAVWWARHWLRSRRGSSVP